MPEIFDRSISAETSLEGYLENDMLKNARKKVKSIMKYYDPYRLPKDKSDEIDRIVSEAEHVLLAEET